MKVKLNNPEFNEEIVRELKDTAINQWEYITKVYGVDCDKTEEVEEFIKSDNPQKFKEQFQTECKVYYNLKQQVREGEVLMKIVEAMSKSLICSISEAEEAVEFVARVLEIVKEDTKQNEPYATTSISQLNQSYRDVSDLIELMENMEEDNE